MLAEDWPDFYLIGAPKCGTTALASYLSDHSRIFVCHPKEPFFFADDFPGVPRAAHTAAAYCNLFASAPPGTLARGEATAMYLYSRVAVPRILAVRPDARFVVLLRNPIELAHAFHSEMVYSQNEDELDFVRAWDLQEQRARGDAIPRTCWEPRFLLYREVASLGEQVERLLRVSDRGKVLLLPFDDFAADTRSAYERVLAFLEVPSDGRRDFPLVNENKRLRYPWLARLTQRPPAVLSRAARIAKSVIGNDRISFLGRVREANLERARRDPIPDSLRARMAEAFADDVERLGRLLNRDLSGWLALPSRDEAPRDGSPALVR